MELPFTKPFESTMRINRTHRRLLSEITAACKFLYFVEKHSSRLVENLDGVKSQQIYLSEFVNVNTSLMHFITLLAEVNCKFEIEMVKLWESSDRSGVTGEEEYVEPVEVRSNEEIELNGPSREEEDTSRRETLPTFFAGDRRRTSVVNERRSGGQMSAFPDANTNPSNEQESDVGRDMTVKSPHRTGHVGQVRLTQCGDMNDFNVLASGQSDTSIQSESQTEGSNKAKLWLETNFNEDPKSESESPQPELEEHVVTVEEIVSPSEFYVSFADRHKEMQSALRQALRDVPGMVPSTAAPCTAAEKTSLKTRIGSDAIYYSICDEAWYRVEVRDWCLTFDDEYVSTFNRDTGESKLVGVQYLREVPASLRKFPTFIRKCHLAGIHPVNQRETEAEYKWMKNSEEKMKLWLLTSDQVRLGVEKDVDLDSIDGSLSVVLWLSERDDSVNEMLIEAKIARANEGVRFPGRRRSTRPDKPEDRREYLRSETDNESDVSKLDKWNPLRESYLSNLNVPEVKLNNPDVAVYGYAGTDTSRICHRYARNGYCYKGKACLKEHTKFTRGGYTTDREEVFANAFNRLPVPDPGDILKVEATCVLDVNEFYCHIRSGVFADADLSDLNDYLNSPVSVRDMKRLVVPPAVGQIVIAMYSSDLAWYRARVLKSEPEKDEYTVAFVDYGNTEVLPLAQMRVMEPRYMHLPFQAVRCLIQGIERSSGCRMDKALAYLNGAVTDRILTVQVVSVQPGDELHLTVRLYDESGTDLGDVLLKQGFATRQTTLITSEDSEILPG